MLIKTIIISVFLVAIIILALGIKLLFDKNAKFYVRSCALNDDEIPGEDGSCPKCGIKELEDCPEKKN